MVFSAVEFLFLFLPITLGLYYIARPRFRNTVLLLASLIFYLWGAGSLTLILLGSIAFNYVFGLLIDRTGSRKLALWVGVAFNVGVLLVFKYLNFFVAQLVLVPGFFDQFQFYKEIALPIGISFYTFQAISYLVDIYRKEAPAAKNPIQFAMYIAMFPQIIAGPIVRYNLVAPLLAEREHSTDAFTLGAIRFTHGLFKKVVIADSVAIIADAAFTSAGQGSLGMAGAWIGMVAYTLQIYFDFSGYSDMAIGLGMMLGFQFPENFNRPYSAVSITDFWRRWHMTLSNWFRDYLYIPLGGSRGSMNATYRNLMIVFLVTGAWHGANWTFILWGIFHGCLLLIERITGTNAPKGSQASLLFRRGLTLLLAMLGWVIFRAENTDVAFAFYAALFDVSDLSLGLLVQESFTNRSLFVMGAACLIFFLPGNFVTGKWLTSLQTRVQATPSHREILQGLNFIQRLYILALLGPALIYIIIEAIANTYSPFLYFQF